MIIKSNLVPSPFWAITIWPFILVKPEHSADPGIIAHEMVHYEEQAWISPIWWLRYWLSKSFRVEAEVRAYKAQIDGRYLTVQQAAAWLMKYDDALSFDTAYKKLA